MRRDAEIVRLTKYAQGMGLKVTFSNAKSSSSSADWNLDGTEITIYARQQDSKTSTILSMVHEIAHHLWFIHEKNRKPDLKFEEAIDFEYFNGDKKPIAKRLRKRIYDMESASTAYWDAIYKETDLGVPKWKLYATMEFDIWMYEIYYKEGHFPGYKRRLQKVKETNAKHKGLKESYV